MFSQIIERPTDLRDTIGSWETENALINGNLRLRYYGGTATGVYGGSTYLATSLKRNFGTALVSYGWDKSKIEWAGDWPIATFTSKRDTIQEFGRKLRRGLRFGARGTKDVREDAAEE